MDAHVPQRKGVVRLSRPHPQRGWSAWLLAIAWMLLLACMPWWIGLPLLLGLGATQLGHSVRLHHYGATIRSALRWGLAGLLMAGYRALDTHSSALTLTLLAALVGFSLLVLFESWQDHKPLRHATMAAASPEWRDMAMNAAGPAANLIELQPPVWLSLDDSTEAASIDVSWLREGHCRIGGKTVIDHVEPSLSMAPGRGWFALPMTSWRGVVLYDRVNDRTCRLRGWHLYGWHASEAWLSRGEDQPPIALSHVLGLDQLEE
ncbi:hypothetical protein [Dyella caseinilytica]|uniref:DUF4131 domain-containing protein n=1 Tax=Dyella caseinilytica TaxID=1849581 RepID=A0ABX7GQV9_9GAMM|nr:hypothetical protein [Dyella caseinilytica]QRN52810.1 hypothetical protein ISN74_15340 [Dyella caseinilytica]GGA08905.1 hypothetical protein GCM10011408_32920 [Dyella caseinilytica]